MNIVEFERYIEIERKRIGEIINTHIVKPFFSKYIKQPEKSSLRVELQNLLVKIRKEEDNLSAIESEYLQRGGTCCASCGVPGFSLRKEKQYRRWRRAGDLSLKLEFSTGRHSRQESRDIINKWINLPNDLQPLWLNRLHRVNYLCKKFKISDHLLDSYLGKKVGIRPLVLEQMVRWCESNEDFIINYNDDSQSRLIT